MLFGIFANDLHTCVQNSNVLQCADDVKLFRGNESISDCPALQHDESCAKVVRNRCETFVQHLCISNMVNSKKTLVPLFCRNYKPLHYIYTLSSAYIKCESTVRGLGILLDIVFTSHCHIGIVMFKSSPNKNEVRQLFVLLRRG